MNTRKCERAQVMVRAAVTCRPATPPLRAVRAQSVGGVRRRGSERVVTPGQPLGFPKGSRRVVVPRTPCPRLRAALRRRAAGRNGCGDSRRDGGPYHCRQGQRRQAQGRLGAGHGLPPVPLDGLTGRVGQRSGAPAAASGENE
jgi:hypothetical protein